MKARKYTQVNKTALTQIFARAGQEAPDPDTLYNFLKELRRLRHRRTESMEDGNEGLVDIYDQDIRDFEAVLDKATSAKRRNNFNTKQAMNQLLTNLQH